MRAGLPIHATISSSFLARLFPIDCRRGRRRQSEKEGKRNIPKPFACAISSSSASSDMRPSSRSSESSLIAGQERTKAQKALPTGTELHFTSLNCVANYLSTLLHSNSCSKSQRGWPKEGGSEVRCQIRHSRSPSPLTPPHRILFTQVDW